ncbi:hypothetical protein TSAR_000277 [Trichomalopsis sarcophagae]|uniref:Uncharacterized protein n=1 Tax=Trichomalopsis sarcophagae TaxID=543379 RepID=A0A232EP91_9HYME|nr:hypothetical protein TSAR_000277 [Trichomalopsis sarcophagae]
MITTCNDQLSKQECNEFILIDKIKTLKSLQEDLHIFLAPSSDIPDNSFTPYTHALTKRGAPFEFIGWTSRQLFGTMDARDRDQLNQYVNRLYKRTVNISTLLASQTHIVKSNLESLHQKLDDAQRTLHKQHLEHIVNSYKTLVNTLETATLGHLHPLLFRHEQLQSLLKTINRHTLPREHSTVTNRRKQQDQITN